MLPPFEVAYKLHSACSLALVYDNTGYAPAWADCPGGGLRHDAHVEAAHTVARTICEMYGQLASGHLWKGLR
jgi:hypothetical protein